MKKLMIMLASLTCMVAFAACGGAGSENSTDMTDNTTTIEQNTTADNESTNENSNDNEIYWLSTYDLNPGAGSDRSAALALFEDEYGGKINWIQCTDENKFDTLSNRLNAGDPVDMFSYEWNALPSGVLKGQYQPLDDYIDLTDSIWDDIRYAIDMFEFNGSHYVIPYEVSDPVLLIYSRTKCGEYGLADPYELYQNGEWDWNTFMDMMKTFTRDNDTAICGIPAQAIVQSTGKAVVNYDGTKFINNINDPDIERAELIMQEMYSSGLYDSNWYSNYPNDGSALFYAMADWALGASNELNPNDDLMVAPFPKFEGSDDYYVSGNYAAKMWVTGSDKGQAVADYITCERRAILDEDAKAVTKANKIAGGITEEQYDAIENIKANTKSVFDFGFGMGSNMYGDGDYTFETRGVMNNIYDGILVHAQWGAPDNWAKLKASFEGVVDSTVKEYNEKIQ